METRKRRKWIQHWHLVSSYMVVYDMLTVDLAYLIVLWLRFDGIFSRIPQEYLNAYLRFVPVYTLFCVGVFWQLRLYNSIWRFAGFIELIRVTAATLITWAFHAIVITVFFQRMPLSYYIFGLMLQFAFTIFIRFAYRFVLLERNRRQRANLKCDRIMLVGAGAAGRLILQEIRKSDEVNAKVHCIIDDNTNKWGRYIEGIPIVGGRGDIKVNVERYGITQIMIAIPSASARERKGILDICQETGCQVKALPGVYQLMNGDVTLAKMKNIDIEDLLGREPIQVDIGDISEYIQGKIVMVTGGGGSIGSELCRQIVEYHPKQLIIYEIYENNAYDIEQELRRRHPNLNLTVLIGSVRDSRRINSVFATYKPEIVYHAAAHKHVPLMETSPNEAIKNNVLGTYKTAYAALQNNCQRFVLISTDKAVNPTNIMGASKRLCEMVVQSMDVVSREGRKELLPFLNSHEENDMTDPINTFVPNKRTVNNGRTEFVAVRFGNVLGSNGSVIPLFRKQIEAGGPVTVTHPEIIRYFMTIPEAVSLVLQAGGYAWGGEIFVLDMGEPMKIDSLARNLIKLSGYKPDEDIKIVYTGLRPGEKLYEEKLMAEEGIKKTDNDMIHIGKPIPLDVEKFFAQLKQLTEVSYQNAEDIEAQVAAMVPTYRPEKGGCEHQEDVMEEIAAASSL